MQAAAGTIDRSQTRCALQLPEQDPDGPLPRQVPPPLLRTSLPEPRALCDPSETVTLRLPCSVTRPDRLPPSETTPLLMVTLYV